MTSVRIACLADKSFATETEHRAKTIHSLRLGIADRPSRSLRSEHKRLTTCGMPQAQDLGVQADRQVVIRGDLRVAPLPHHREAEALQVQADLVGPSRPRPHTKEGAAVGEASLHLALGLRRQPLFADAPSTGRASFPTIEVSRRHTPGQRVRRLPDRLLPVHEYEAGLQRSAQGRGRALR